MPQYYNVGGTYYSMDKAAGTAQQIGSIPVGGATITWNGQGLPPELQSALGKPAQSAPVVSPAVSNATPTYGAVNTSPNVAQPGQTQAITSMPAYTDGDLASMNTSLTYLSKNAKTADDYNALSALQTKISTEQARQNGITAAAKQLISSGQGSVGINNYYSSLSPKDQALVQPILGSSVIAGYQTPGANTKTTVTGAGQSLATPAPITTAPSLNASPSATAPTTTTTPAVTAANAQPYSAPTTGVASSLPGGTATDLQQYYTAQGKTLPTVAARAPLFAQLGLGTADEYKGTAQQNEEMLSAMQRQDIAQHNLGSSPISSVPVPGAATKAVDSTDAGMSLAAALSGGTASDTLASYKAYLATALGASVDKLNSDTSSLNSFFSSTKSATDILNEAMASAGIPQQQSLLTQLDSEIASQTATLKNLPDDIKSTLADVGVSQAQLDRLVAKESKGPTDALNTLLTQRNATADEINRATTFASQFAQTQLADQAAKLSALEWMVTSDKGDYNNLDQSMRAVIQQGVSDQKDIMTTALTAAKNGADQTTIDNVLGSDNPIAAMSAAGSYLAAPAATPGTSSMTTDIKNAGSALELGLASKGYNGRGPDGYVDPNLYVALYTQAQSQYGDAGAAAFLAKYPPSKDINPANIGTGRLPVAVENAVKAAQKKTGSSSAAGGIVIDSAAINAALTGVK